jgi:hypothetical protein
VIAIYVKPHSCGRPFKPGQSAEIALGYIKPTKTFASERDIGDSVIVHRYASEAVAGLIEHDERPAADRGADEASVGVKATPVRAVPFGQPTE